MKTKFEIGKTYPMKQPGKFGKVLEIRLGELWVRHLDDQIIYSHRLDGSFIRERGRPCDLLLPAIGEEAAHE